jgi:hypothetical protein
VPFPSPREFDRAGHVPLVDIMLGH